MANTSYHELLKYPPDVLENLEDTFLALSTNSLPPEARIFYSPEITIFDIANILGESKEPSIKKDEDNEDSEAISQNLRSIVAKIRK